MSELKFGEYVRPKCQKPLRDSGAVCFNCFVRDNCLEVPVPPLTQMLMVDEKDVVKWLCKMIEVFVNQDKKGFTNLIFSSPFNLSDDDYFALTKAVRDTALEPHEEASLVSAATPVSGIKDSEHKHEAGHTTKHERQDMLSDIAMQKLLSDVMQERKEYASEVAKMFTEFKEITDSLKKEIDFLKTQVTNTEVDQNRKDPTASETPLRSEQPEPTEADETKPVYPQMCRYCEQGVFKSATEPLGNCKPSGIVVRHDRCCIRFVAVTDFDAKFADATETEAEAESEPLTCGQCEHWDQSGLCCLVHRQYPANFLACIGFKEAKKDEK